MYQRQLIRYEKSLNLLIIIADVWICCFDLWMFCTVGLACQDPLKVHHDGHIMLFKVTLTFPIMMLNSWHYYYLTDPGLIFRISFLPTESQHIYWKWVIRNPSRL